MNRIDTAMLQLEHAMRKTPERPLAMPAEHPVFPPLPEGAESFQEQVRALTLRNQQADAALCARCGRPRIEHITSLPTPVSPGISLICPTATTFEAKAEEAPAS